MSCYWTEFWFKILGESLIGEDTAGLRVLRHVCHSLAAGFSLYIQNDEEHISSYLMVLFFSLDYGLSYYNTATVHLN